MTQRMFTKKQDQTKGQQLKERWRSEQYVWLFGCSQPHNSDCDVDNNQGIDDNNKCNVHIIGIIDVKSEKIDAETKSINVGEYTNTIYAEVVDRKDDIHFYERLLLNKSFDTKSTTNYAIENTKQTYVVSVLLLLWILSVHGFPLMLF